MTIGIAIEVLSDWRVLLKHHVCTPLLRGKVVVKSISKACQFLVRVGRLVGWVPLVGTIGIYMNLLVTTFTPKSFPVPCCCPATLSARRLSAKAYSCPLVPWSVSDRRHLIVRRGLGYRRRSCWISAMTRLAFLLLLAKAYLFNRCSNCRYNYDTI